MATYVQELSEKITALIGYPLGEDHIHHIEADGSGWHYYIERLKPGYPVLAMHYRGPLMLVLPFADYSKLEAGEIAADTYIAESHWNYGYFWGGGGLLSGAYWQPLEAEPGIHDTTRISRYLNILGCRTDRVSSGYRPSSRQCQECRLDETHCPFSPLNQTGSWENEIREPDGRHAVFEAASRRVEAELGFALSDILSHHYGRERILLFPGYRPNTVSIYLDAELLNDILYHPDADKDWAEVVSTMEIWLCIPWKPAESVALPDDIADKRAFCLDFWGDRMPQDTENVPEGGALPATVDGSQSMKKPSLFGKIATALREKFQR